MKNCSDLILTDDLKDETCRNTATWLWELYLPWHTRRLGKCRRSSKVGSIYAVKPVIDCTQNRLIESHIYAGSIGKQCSLIFLVGLTRQPALLAFFPATPVRKLSEGQLGKWASDGRLWYTYKTLALSPGFCSIASSSQVFCIGLQICVQKWSLPSVLRS